MEYIFDATTAIQNQMNKINAEIKKYTQGLPENEKAYIVEMLTSASYSEITIETALDRIQVNFGEQARTNAESLMKQLL